MTKKNNGAPPTLTRRGMTAYIKKARPEFPEELIQIAIREIINSVSSSLAAERPVILRGFGRFTTRRYQGSAKQLGLIFRPSPSLSSRLGQPDESFCKTSEATPADD